MCYSIKRSPAVVRSVSLSLCSSYSTLIVSKFGGSFHSEVLIRIWFYIEFMDWIHDLCCFLMNEATHWPIVFQFWYTGSFICEYLQKFIWKQNLPLNRIQATLFPAPDLWNMWPKAKIWRGSKTRVKEKDNHIY